MGKFSIRNVYNCKSISTSDAPSYEYRGFDYGFYEIMVGNTKRLFHFTMVSLTYPSSDGQNYAIIFLVSSVDGVYYNTNNYNYQYSKINYVVTTQAEEIRSCIYTLFGNGTVYNKISYDQVPQWIVNNYSYPDRVTEQTGNSYFNNRLVKSKYVATYPVTTFIKYTDQSGNLHFGCLYGTVFYESIDGANSIDMFFDDYSTRTKNTRTHYSSIHYITGTNLLADGMETAIAAMANRISSNAEQITYDELFQLIANKFTSFHSDPVYLEATKLRYTDGTYNFIQGVANADRARKAGYKHLLNTYGTFYKGTEREMSDSFAQSLGD